MSTKVKVGIAAVIVSALVALIVLDQKTTSNPETKAAPAVVDKDITVGGPATIAPPGDPGFPIEVEPVPAPRPGKGVEKGKENSGKEIKPVEEYVVVDGDNFEKIAKKALGDGKYASLIAQANPNVKPTALKPGQRLLLPAKPEKKVEEKKSDVAKKDETPGEPKKEEVAPKSDTVTFRNGPKGERIYTVQPGDTLSGISVKVYNTSRYVDKIVEANKLDDPSLLYVGLKLVMPDLPRKEGASVANGAGTANTSTAAPAAGKKTYTVKPGENLWKIAAAIAGDKGIEETMRAIVNLNSGKLKSIGDVVQAGWQLVMPE